jgi:hypothetical protein
LCIRGGFDVDNALAMESIRFPLKMNTVDILGIFFCSLMIISSGTMVLGLRGKAVIIRLYMVLHLLNVILQVVSIAFLLVDKYEMAYLVGIVEQSCLLAMNLQNIRILELFSFFSPSITPGMIKILRIAVGILWFITVSLLATTGGFLVTLGEQNEKFILSRTVLRYCLFSAVSIYSAYLTVQYGYFLWAIPRKIGRRMRNAKIKKLLRNSNIYFSIQVFLFMFGIYLYYKYTVTYLTAYFAFCNICHGVTITVQMKLLSIWSQVVASQNGQGAIIAPAPVQAAVQDPGVRNVSQSSHPQSKIESAKNIIGVTP